jgi:type II secretory pathway pseudopilin PulG
MSGYTPIQASQKPRRRWWKRVLLGILLAILVPTVIYRYNAWRLDRELDEVIAELDRTDSGWRLEDIEKNRKVVADEQNGAFIVTAAAKAIPKDWLQNAVWDDIAKQSPVVVPNDEQITKLRTELKPVAAVLAGGPQARACLFRSLSDQIR